MTVLFTSCACDYCDGLAREKLYSGFIVLQPERIGRGARVCVFPTPAAAAKWRSANRLKHLPICEVKSLEPFAWAKSRGTVDVELASHAYEIFPDHKYPPGPYRAFVSPNEPVVAPS